MKACGKKVGMKNSKLVFFILLLCFLFGNCFIIIQHSFSVEQSASNKNIVVNLFSRNGRIASDAVALQFLSSNFREIMRALKEHQDRLINEQNNQDIVQLKVVLNPNRYNFFWNETEAEKQGEINKKSSIIPQAQGTLYKVNLPYSERSEKGASAGREFLRFYIDSTATVYYCFITIADQKRAADAFEEERRSIPPPTDPPPAPAPGSKIDPRFEKYPVPKLIDPSVVGK